MSETLNFSFTNKKTKQKTKPKKPQLLRSD